MTSPNNYLHLNIFRMIEENLTSFSIYVLVYTENRLCSFFCDCKAKKHLFAKFGQKKNSLKSMFGKKRTYVF